VKRGARGSGISVDPARVRAARIAAGLSLGQVAGHQVSRTFIHLVEQGRSRPSRAVLALIARRTGKPMDYFRSTASGKAESSNDLATDLSVLASRVRRFLATNPLNEFEREAMKLVEASLHHGASLARAIELKTPPSLPDSVGSKSTASRARLTQIPRPSKRPRPG
jgi:transcriptional regulator with XRE-family HTH domain